MYLTKTADTFWLWRPSHQRRLRRRCVCPSRPFRLTMYTQKANSTPGQLPMFLGWIVVLLLSECIALSLSEFASRYPTSAGPYYWSFQLATPRYRTVLSFVTGWAWLIGNWTITLSVNFGFASLIAATVALYRPDFAPAPWQLLLMFWGICLLTFVVVAYGNRVLPVVDTVCAVFTAGSILVTLVCLSVRAGVGRHSVRDTLVSAEVICSC